jgi:hypothetical protein
MKLELYLAQQCLFDALCLLLIQAEHDDSGAVAVVRFQQGF